MNRKPLPAFLFTLAVAPLAGCAVDATPASQAESTVAALPSTDTGSNPHTAGKGDDLIRLCLAQNESVTNDIACVVDTETGEQGNPHPPYVYGGFADGYAPPVYSSSCEKQAFFYVPMGACPSGVSVSSGESATLRLTSDLNSQAISQAECQHSYLDYTAYAANGVLVGSGTVYGTYVSGICSLGWAFEFPGELPNGLDIYTDSYEAVVWNGIVLSTAPVGVSMYYQPAGRLAP